MSELLWSYNSMTDKNSISSILNMRNSKSDESKNAWGKHGKNKNAREKTVRSFSCLPHSLPNVFWAIPNVGSPAMADVPFSIRVMGLVFQIPVLPRNNLFTEIDGQMSTFYWGIISNASVKITWGHLSNVSLWILFFCGAEHVHRNHHILPCSQKHQLTNCKNMHFREYNNVQDIK